MVLPITFLVLGSILSPPAGAALPVTFLPPYGGAHVNHLALPTAHGCATVGADRARANASQGKGAIVERVDAHTCGPNNGGAFNASYAQATMQVTLTIPVGSPTTSAGPVSVRVDVGLSGTTNNSSKVRWNCPPAVYNASQRYGFSGCTAAYTAVFAASVSLLDNSNGSLVVSSTPFAGLSLNNLRYSDDYCYAYGCAWSNYSFAYSYGQLSGNYSWWVNTTLNPAHYYTVVFHMLCFISAAVVGFPGSYSRETMEIGTSHHHWHVSSIVIS